MREVTPHPGVVLQEGTWGQQGTLQFQQGMGELGQQSCWSRLGATGMK